MKLRNVFKSKSSAGVAPSESAAAAPSGRRASTMSAMNHRPQGHQHSRTVLDASPNVKPPTLLKRRERRPDPLDGASMHRRKKQDLLDRKKPITKQAVKAKPMVKKKLMSAANSAASGASPAAKKPARLKQHQQQQMKSEISELDRILSGDAPPPPTTPRRATKKKTLDEVLSRGRSKKINGGAKSVGGGRSVASRKSLKSRASSKGPKKSKLSSNPQGGSDENTSANSDTMHGKQSIRSNRTTRTAPPSMMEQPRPRGDSSHQMLQQRRGRGRSKSRPRKPLVSDDEEDDENNSNKPRANSKTRSPSANRRRARSLSKKRRPSLDHVESNINDNATANTNNTAPTSASTATSTYHTPRGARGKLKATKSTGDIHLLSPAEQKLKAQIERVKKDVHKQSSPNSKDDTTSTDNDDEIFCSPKAMPTVSQDILQNVNTSATSLAIDDTNNNSPKPSDDEPNNEDKESYFRQRIQHYQSEFFNMQVQLTEAQNHIEKLMELRKKDKSRLEDAAEKFIELKTTSKQSKIELRNLNDRIYELEDLVVKREKESAQLQETVESHLDKIDELERIVEEHDDPILCNYKTAPSPSDKIRDLNAWEEELKAKEERLNTLDSIHQYQQKEDELKLREEKLRIAEQQFQSKQRELQEQESKYHRQMKSIRNDNGNNNNNGIPNASEIVKIQDLQKEISEKDFQLEKASKAFLKMEKKHNDAIDKLKQEQEKLIASLERKLKHEQRRSESNSNSNSSNNDNGMNKDEIIAELKLELAKMEDELNANDPVGYASKLKTEVMLLKEQNRVLKSQLDAINADALQKLQKKDETIAFMQNELVKIKLKA